MVHVIMFTDYDNGPWIHLSINKNNRSVENKSKSAKEHKPAVIKSRVDSNLSLSTFLGLQKL